MTSSQEAETALVVQVRARRRSLRAAAVLIFAICFGTAVVIQLVSDDGRIARLIGGFVCGSFLAALLALPTLGDPRKHGAVVALLDGPQAVVWLYMAVPRPPPPGYVRVSGRGGGGSTLYVCKDDGRKLPFEVKRPDEEKILALASALVPWATVGWSPEADAHYARAPASLRRSG